MQPNEVIETYVYDNTEVRMTGRKSQRPLRSGKMDVLWEITPITSMDGTWKKWVSKNDLFMIQ